VILSGHSLIVFGGTGFPFGSHLSNSLHICNLKTLEWQQRALQGDKPLALYGSSMVLIENDLYILFGTNSRIYCSNVYKINMKTLECKKLFDSVELINKSMNYTDTLALNNEYPNDFLIGRYRQEVLHHDGKIYAFGGGKNDGDSCSMELVINESNFF
jgi:hypothetical protein